MYRSHRFLFAVIVALLAMSPVVMPVAATPGPDGAGPLLQTKAERKAEAEARKDAKKAEKQLKQCTAKGTLPCNPTVTLTWTRGHLDPDAAGCIPVVSVTGFAPRTYAIRMDGPIRWYITVGSDGRGNVIMSNPDATQFVVSFIGYTTSAIVDGVESAPSTAAC